MNINNHRDNHVVIDNDKYFIIDQETKTINVPEGMATKKRLVERDHNSERFTFELDRYVEGHDMLECDTIRVQYLNSSRDGLNTSTGVYEVDDVYLDSENNKIIFTWLISRAATKYEGTTVFNIVFMCYGEEATVAYSWATEIYKKVQILANINAESSEEEYIDILEQWRQEFEQDIQSKRTKYAIQRVADYLYTIEYDELNYEEGMAYFLNRFNPEIGACSSVRNKNFYGRDYDWYYDNKASIVVKRKGTKGKYANVGVVSSYILDEMAKDGNYDSIYDVVPFGILDGINEKGVVCNINVVPEMDRKSTTTGTNPGKEDVPMACLVRKILDECATADEAVYKIQNDYNIIAPDIDNLSMEMHYMIGDPNKTYVVEFVDNAPVIIDTFVDDKPIMTNFYLDTFNIVDNVKTGLTLHAQGLERYDILSQNYDTVKSAEQMLDLMRRVNYTKTYNKSLNPFWYSEFYTYWPDHGDFNINSDHAAFKPIIDNFIDEHFPSRDREEIPPSTWQTVHTSVYDIEKRKLILSVQESSQTYEFDLEIPGENLAIQNLIKAISVAENEETHQNELLIKFQNNEEMYLSNLLSLSDAELSTEAKTIKGAINELANNQSNAVELDVCEYLFWYAHSNVPITENDKQVIAELAEKQIGNGILKLPDYSTRVGDTVPVAFFFFRRQYEVSSFYIIYFEPQTGKWMRLDTVLLAYGGNTWQVYNSNLQLQNLGDDSTHRTVTDVEKATWNSKADVSDIPTTLAELTPDSTHQTVTSTEKANWNKSPEIIEWKGTQSNYFPGQGFVLTDDDIKQLKAIANNWVSYNKQTLIIARSSSLNEAVPSLYVADCSEVESVDDYTKIKIWSNSVASDYTSEYNISASIANRELYTFNNEIWNVQSLSYDRLLTLHPLGASQPTDEDKSILDMMYYNGINIGQPCDYNLQIYDEDWSTDLIKTYKPSIEYDSQTKTFTFTWRPLNKEVVASITYDSGGWSNWNITPNLTVIPDALSQLSEDEDHQLVTQEDKVRWGQQVKLINWDSIFGVLPENEAYVTEEEIEVLQNITQDYIDYRQQTLVYGTPADSMASGQTLFQVRFEGEPISAEDEWYNISFSSNSASSLFYNDDYEFIKQPSTLIISTDGVQWYIDKQQQVISGLVNDSGYTSVHTVKFLNGTEVLQKEAVVDGETTWYKGETPIYHGTGLMNFIGWSAGSESQTIVNPSTYLITEDINFVARYEGVSFADSTPQTIKTYADAGHINPLDDTQFCYTVDGQDVVIFEVGDEKTITLTNGDEIVVQIYGFNHNNKTGGGVAPITIGLKGLYGTSLLYGGWGSPNWTQTSLYSKLINNIYPLIPQEWKNVIVPVDVKYYTDSTTVSSVSCNLFTPASVEIFGAAEATYPNEGTQYPIFTDADSMKKIQYNGESPTAWWTRTGKFDNYNFVSVGNDGSRIISFSYINQQKGICFCFCI